MDLTQYTNFETELDETIVQNAVSRIRQVLYNSWPELDTSPSSPFGNLFVAPAARIMALTEQASDCMLSDFNLNNALNGLVCDCDFVENVLKGLGVNSLSEVNTTGMVRLVFNADQQYTFDQGELLLFNNQYIFNFVGGNNSTITILPTTATQATDKANNIYKLSVDSLNTVAVDYFGAGRFYVDIPVYGPATADVVAGSNAAVDENFGNPIGGNNLVDTYIIEVSLLQDVTPLKLPTTLDELIKLTRQIQPSTNITTRANSISYIVNNFPAVYGASSVLAGDAEMKRNVHPLYRFDMPSVDLYAKGGLISCTEYIKVVKNDNYYTSASLYLQHIPQLFLNIGIGAEDTSLARDPDVYGKWCVASFMPATTNNSSVVVNGGGSYATTTWIPQVGSSTIGHLVTIDDSDADMPLLQIASEAVPKPTGDVSSNIVKSTITGRLYSVQVDPLLGTTVITQITPETWAYNYNSDNLSYAFNIPNVSADTTNGLSSTETTNLETCPVVDLVDTYYVSVTYLYDPLEEAISKTIASPACAPALDVITRPFFPAYVKSLTINYKKEAGKFFDRQTALTNLQAFLDKLLYPVVYDDAYIADIMISAGASSVDSITADVFFTVGAALQPPEGFVYTTMPLYMEENSLYVPTPVDTNNIVSAFGLGTRNVQYIVPNREAIKLVETII